MICTKCNDTIHSQFIKEHMIKVHGETGVPTIIPITVVEDSAKRVKPQDRIRRQATI